MTDNWLEARELLGPRLLLAPLRLGDAGDFRRALGTPAEAEEVLRHLSYGPPADLSEAARIVTDLLSLRDAVVYAQRLREGGELVGVTSFYDVSADTRSLAIGQTWLARQQWRTGANTEAKLLLLRRAFDELGAERVVWHTDIANRRSQAAIERLGATREGVLRHHRIRRDGSWRDTVLYSMLSAEWPAARARLESTPAQATLVVHPRVEVANAETESRYVGRVAGEEVGDVMYRIGGSSVVITHTGTDPRWRGQGVAAQITRFALDDVAASGRQVVPACPYTARFIEQHPEYRGLLA